MSKDLIGNFILRYFIGLIADRQAENKAKAGECEHLKWGRWRKTMDSIGVMAQERNCKRCNFCEIKLEKYIYTSAMSEHIDIVIEEKLTKLALNKVLEENQNDNT